MDEGAGGADAAGCAGGGAAVPVPDAVDAGGAAPVPVPDDLVEAPPVAGPLPPGDDPSPELDDPRFAACGDAASRCPASTEFTMLMLFRLFSSIVSKRMFC